MFVLAIIMAEGSTTLPRETLLYRLRRFLSRSAHEKSRSLYARWKKMFPSTPFPFLLPFGAWFIARGDYLGSTLTADAFELAERAFLRRFLEPGMTVLDVGAHHGLYTLLAARQVTAQGRVYSFEPSPREQKALRLNLRLNRCKNVTMEPFALGSEEASADLYVVNEFNTGCNSLRPPEVTEQTSRTLVRIRTLDNWIAEQKLERVDFIKLDVEGAELSVIKGASKLLSQQPRPVIMAEVESFRTEPWGYSAMDIIKLLEDLNFYWFKPLQGGQLRPFNEKTDQFLGNYVAIPKESREAVLARAEQTC